jgi:hypothetical protein
MVDQATLSWACALLQSAPKCRAAAVCRTNRHAAAPRVRFVAPTASPRAGQRLLYSALPGLSASVFRFSQPPDAFIRPAPAGHVSDRIRSWGPHPSELCPSHAAVRRFRRLCPHDVSDNPLRLSPPSSSRRQKPKSNPLATTLNNVKARGLPSSSGPCSTQESATLPGVLDRPGHVALLGFFPSRVFPLAGMARPSPCLPS